MEWGSGGLLLLTEEEEEDEEGEVFLASSLLTEDKDSEEVQCVGFTMRCDSEAVLAAPGRLLKCSRRMVSLRSISSTYLTKSKSSWYPYGVSMLNGLL